MTGSENVAVFDAWDPAPATTAEVVVLDVQQETVGRDVLGTKGFGIAANATATLRVDYHANCAVKSASSPPCKFKIIAVSSC